MGNTPAGRASSAVRRSIWVRTSLIGQQPSPGRLRGEGEGLHREGGVDRRVHEHVHVVVGKGLPAKRGGPAKAQVVAAEDEKEGRLADPGHRGEPARDLRPARRAPHPHDGSLLEVRLRARGERAREQRLHQRLVDRLVPVAAVGPAFEDPHDRGLARPLGGVAHPFARRDPESLLDARCDGRRHPFLLSDPRRGIGPGLGPAPRAPGGDEPQCAPRRASRMSRVRSSCSPSSSPAGRGAGSRSAGWWDEGARAARPCVAATPRAAGTRRASGRRA